MFPSNQRDSDSRRPLSYQWFHRRFKAWIDNLDIGRWVPHRARHSLDTRVLRAGASLTHIRRYLGQVSERMADHYVHSPNPTWKTCPSTSGSPAPAPPIPANSSQATPPPER
nr:hypothetical protein Ade03nite_64010 [Actinoplanes derwentensis]